MTRPVRLAWTGVWIALAAGAVAWIGAVLS
jgi:hypothetical protein